MESIEQELNTNHPVRDSIQRSTETVRAKASTCCETLSRETDKICERTKDGIRKNPVGSVVGAAVFGAAVTYFLLEACRREASFSERYINGPLEDVGNSLGSALHNLKFW